MPNGLLNEGIPTVETVYAIADEAGDRYRALVLTAALAGLRLG